MNKKLLIKIIMAFLLLAGCRDTTSTNIMEQNGQSPSVSATTNITNEKSSATITPAATTTPVSTSTITTSDLIDYNQFVKKTWVVKNDANNERNPSFYISEIKNGKITGHLSVDGVVVPNEYYYLPNYYSDLDYFFGTINKDTAECQFSSKGGDDGSVDLVFKPNGEIKATIKFTRKEISHKDASLDGTFDFTPYNLKDVDGFTSFKDQSFTVDLNSWGNVRFVSGKIKGVKRIVTVLYLTNKDGDILYDFGSPFPYDVDVKAVSFKDVNKDGLKDVIVLLSDGYDSSSEIQLARVFLQKADGLFMIDDELNQELNDSGNIKNIKTVADYLSKKF